MIDIENYAGLLELSNYMYCGGLIKCKTRQDVEREPQTRKPATEMLKWQKKYNKIHRGGGRIFINQFFHLHFKWYPPSGLPFHKKPIPSCLSLLPFESMRVLLYPFTPSCLIVLTSPFSGWLNLHRTKPLLLKLLLFSEFGHSNRKLD